MGLILPPKKDTVQDITPNGATPTNENINSADISSVSNGSYADSAADVNSHKPAPPPRPAVAPRGSLKGQGKPPPPERPSAPPRKPAQSHSPHIKQSPRVPRQRLDSKETDV